LVPSGANSTLSYEITRLTYRDHYAGMAELVDAPDLGLAIPEITGDPVRLVTRTSTKKRSNLPPAGHLRSA
jgi:hypothetical protein